MSDILNATKWETPDSYAGFNPIGDYCVCSKTRDSSLMEENNFDVFKRELETRHKVSKEYVYSWEASHWACGWVQYLMLKPSAPQELLDCAESLLADLADYPSLDDDSYSERQYDAICDYWESESIGGRIELIKEYDLCIEPNIFAARRSNDIPEAVFDGLYQSEMFQ